MFTRNGLAPPPLQHKQYSNKCPPMLNLDCVISVGYSPEWERPLYLCPWWFHSRSLLAAWTHPRWRALCSRWLCVPQRSWCSPLSAIPSQRRDFYGLAMRYRLNGSPKLCDTPSWTVMKNVLTPLRDDVISYAEKTIRMRAPRIFSSVRLPQKKRKKRMRSSAPQTHHSTAPVGGRTDACWFDSNSSSTKAQVHSSSQ